MAARRRLHLGPRDREEDPPSRPRARPQSPTSPRIRSRQAPSQVKRQKYVPSSVPKLASFNFRTGNFFPCPLLFDFIIPQAPSRRPPSRQAPRLRRKLRPRQDQRQGPQGPKGPFRRQHPPRLSKAARCPSSADCPSAVSTTPSSAITYAPVNLAELEKLDVSGTDRRSGPAQGGPRQRHLERRQGARRRRGDQGAFAQGPRRQRQRREKIEKAGGSIELVVARALSRPQLRKARRRGSLQGQAESQEGLNPGRGIARPPAQGDDAAFPRLVFP